MSHFSKIEPDGVIEKIYNSRHVENLMAAIHRDDLYRICSPYEDGFRCAWALVAPDQSEALTTIVVMRTPEIRQFIFRFQGLDPNKYYRCDYDHRVYSGALLMYGGINLTDQLSETGSSLKLCLEPGPGPIRPQNLRLLGGQG